jgi:non-lysosomal glucosylceramidase
VAGNVVDFDEKNFQVMYSSAAKVCLTSLCYILVGLLTAITTHAFFFLSLLQKGAFDSGNWHSGISKPSQKGASIGAALAAQVLIPPNEKKEVVFALAWDSPEAKFGKGSSYYRCASGHFKRMPNLCLFLPYKISNHIFRVDCRRYTQFYGTKGHAASKLAHDALLGT